MASTFFNTRLQFDWLGRGERLIDLSIRAAQSASQQNMQRDIANARNMLEFRRQQEQIRQFEKDFKLNETRVEATRRYYDYLGQSQKNRIAQQGRDAEEARVLEEWGAHLSTLGTSDAIANSYRKIPKGLSAQGRKAASEMIDGALNVFSETKAGKTQALAAKRHQDVMEQLEPDYLANVVSLPIEEQPAAAIRALTAQEKWKREAALLDKRIAESERAIKAAEGRVPTVSETEMLGSEGELIQRTVTTKRPLYRTGVVAPGTSETPIAAAERVFTFDPKTKTLR